MKTFNLQLTEKEHEEIRQLSLETGIPMSELYRRGGPEYGRKILEAMNIEKNRKYFEINNIGAKE